MHVPLCSFLFPYEHNLTLLLPSQQELEGFPSFRESLAPPVPQPPPAAVVTGFGPLRLTNALAESNDRISLSASQAGMAGIDPEFYRTIG